MTLEDEFGDIILKARAGLGLSVDFVSKETGIHKTEITQLEALARNPTPEQVESFARLLHLNSDKLMDIAFHRYVPKPAPTSLSQNVITILGYIGAYEVKGYLVIDPSTRETAMIDTAFHPEAMIEAISQNRLKLNYILLTHTHHDHMGGIDKIREKFDVPIYVSREEAGQLGKSWNSGKDRFVEEGKPISLGNLILNVFHTPGHTPGGTGYVCQQADVSFGFFGDAIFAGSLGRAYATASFPQLIQSVRTKVLTLPEETVLFPGHGPASTVAEEKKHNPFFNTSGD
ncbi:MAG: MBL fold metallo-hydrolase [Nitrospirae bacterium]|nr:MBL fold metallo-hydrolase [Nitrospirota bacterium]MBI3352189.1 MBL fold metallo-hydrolase [Nitrospirota bacterium]